MDNSSIFDSLDRNDLISELLLQISHPNNVDKCFILFEGKDDIFLFKKLLTNNCLGFESYGGKQDIITILSSPLLTDDRIIGIVDRDYSSYINKRLFYCDYCNAEMMVISCDEVFNDLICSITTKPADYSSLRNLYLDMLAPLSAIRKRNEEHSLSIEFAIDINYMIRNTTCSLNEYVTKLNHAALNSDFSINSILYNHEETLVKTNCLSYTNGHDFCSGLRSAVNKTLFRGVKKTNLSEDEVRARIYLAYNKEYFSKTNLYSQLISYGQTIGIDIVY